MKKIMMVAILTLSASQVFATHAYRTQECFSTTHKMEYTGNYPMGGSYAISKLSANSEIVESSTIELFDAGDEEGGSVSDPQSFSIYKAKVVNSKTQNYKCQSKNDIGFDEEKSKSEMVVIFGQLNQEEQSKSGIRAGEYMLFKCKQTFSMPRLCGR